MTRLRRLPGVRFAAAPPPPPEALPRLDVPLFVGFARAGPVETPVAVEEPAGFAAVFGGDLPLAWDPVARATATAHLPAAVRAFFRQGGRRCWVVRVVGKGARANTFPVPGLLGVRAAGGGREFVPASVAARSVGSWSDSLRVGAAVDARPVPYDRFDRATGTIVLKPAGRDAVEVGDLLRLTDRGAGVVAFVAVTAVAPDLRVMTESVAAFRALGRVTTEAATEPAPGSVIQAGSAWAVVRESRLPVLSPLGGTEIDGDGFEPLGTSGLAELTDPRPVLDRLRLELWVRDREQGAVAARDLGLTSRHPRFWGSVPPDEEAFAAGVGGPRFPLARDGKDWVAGIPLGLGVVPEWFLERHPTTDQPIERDGLREMGPRLFLGGDDRRFAALDTATTRDLLGRIEDFRYAVEPHVPLRGIYHALGLDEVTLVAVPDAVQPGWTEKEGEAPPVPPEPRAFPLPVVTFGFEACEPPQPEPTPEPLPPPKPPAAVRWWEVNPTPDADGVLAVQTALLRMCAANGELFAVLALPAGYRTPEAIEYADRLRVRFASEPHALGYGALYHPWLVGREGDADGPIRARPPDGAATGVIARRTLARGAWVAPANERFADVLALDPVVPPEDRQSLQDAQVNLVRNDPRGVLCLGADTLTRDEDLRPISVRRLLTLLRRAAARLGVAYVFEPNGPALWRAARVGFEGLLTDLFRRGAFAGNTPAEGFRVRVGPGDGGTGDSGRFVIELAVAPAVPMRFITVRLVRTDDGLQLTEGR